MEVLTTLNVGKHLCSGGGVEIGDGVMIGANIVISSVSHRMAKVHRHDPTWSLLLASFHHFDG